MPGMAMAPTFRSWTVAEFAIVFAMWSVMMIGMMTPAIAPAILTHARLGSHPVARSRPLAPVGWFVSGYLLAWLGYALIASVTQAVFLAADLITPTLRSSSDLFSGIVFIVAGGFQLTRLKSSCLSLCRSPVGYINEQGGFGPSTVSSLNLGFRHGLYCVTCCWALMSVLFVIGVMELLWIAIISMWVLLEKIFPAPRVMTRLSGFALILAGVILIIRTAL